MHKRFGRHSIWHVTLVIFDLNQIDVWTVFWTGQQIYVKSLFSRRDERGEKCLTVSTADKLYFPIEQRKMKNEKNHAGRLKKKCFGSVSLPPLSSALSAWKHLNAKSSELLWPGSLCVMASDSSGDKVKTVSVSAWVFTKLHRIPFLGTLLYARRRELPNLENVCPLGHIWSKCTSRPLRGLVSQFALRNRSRLEWA